LGVSQKAVCFLLGCVRTPCINSCLQTKRKHVDLFHSADTRYDERIDRVETRITSRLRDQLGTAKNANEMFRIFSKFNALFVRPRIRGAIREYQTQLIQRVKDDIENLQTKFKAQFNQSFTSKMSAVRDLPPVSAHIIWARQISRQLQTYMMRVEDVLGKGWENHLEGRALKETGDSFKQKLDPQPYFEKWSLEVQQRNLGMQGRIFMIDTKHVPETQLVLSVNFHPQIIELFKEVRNLKWLNFRVPLVVVNKALQANHLYPFAISLMASVRSYSQILDKLNRTPEISALVAEFHKTVQTRLTEGVTLRWESYRLEPFVQNFAEEVAIFQDKVDDLLVSNAAIDKAVASLETAPYNQEQFQHIIETIQKVCWQICLFSLFFIVCPFELLHACIPHSAKGINVVCSNSIWVLFG
jgi:dynein heavy chain 1